MSIFLHSECAKGQSTEANHNGWVDVDLVSWSNQDSQFTHNITLIRRLSREEREPNLQQLMFTSLYEGQTINKIVVDVPAPQDSHIYSRYTLERVKVINYSIKPPNESNKKMFEKITLQAEQMHTGEANY